MVGALLTHSTIRIAQNYSSRDEKLLSKYVNPTCPILCQKQKLQFVTDFQKQLRGQKRIQWWQPAEIWKHGCEIHTYFNTVPYGGNIGLKCMLDLAKDNIFVAIWATQYFISHLHYLWHYKLKQYLHQLLQLLIVNIQQAILKMTDTKKCTKIGSLTVDQTMYLLTTLICQSS